MRRLHFLFLALLLLSIAVPAHAGTFYVDNSGSPACSSSNNGSQTSPWCTISSGLSRIASGDTLMVKGGTYREDVYISGPAGTASKPTIIQVFPGQKATILGSGVDSGRVKIDSTSYITFDGFIITNFNQGLFVDSSNHIVVQNVEIHHVGQEGLHVELDSSFITIQNNKIHDTRQWQYNGEGIYVGHGSTASTDHSNNVTIRGNTVYNTNDEGIEIKPGTHDNIVEGNNVSAALLDPAYASPTAGSIEINEAVNVGGGNQSWPSNPNHIVRNNVVHNSKTGIRAGTGCTVYNNVIYGISSPYNGIYADNLVNDSYTRNIYHNTVDLPTARAIVVSGATVDMRNNIGPSGTNNLATSDSYYVNKSAADYHLVAGSAPINAGVNLTNVVPTDIAGTSRLTSPPPDLGAYEYASNTSSGPNPPTNLSATVN